MPTQCQQIERSLTIEGVDLTVSTLRRDGPRAPILFLHGFGSTKEDYADSQRYGALDPRGILAFDAPGCGQTTCSDLSAVNIPFLVKTALAMLAADWADAGQHPSRPGSQLCQYRRKHRARGLFPEPPDPRLSD